MAAVEPINVLYVDDENDNLTSFIGTFRRSFTVFTAISAKEAEAILVREDIHVLITDQRMPVKTGTELLAHAVKKYPDKIRILLTAYADINCLEDAINCGHVFKYFKKPWNEAELKKAIEEGYKEFDLRKRERDLLKRLSDKKKEE